MLQVYKELLVEHHKIIPPQYVSKVVCVCVCVRERERERERERARLRVWSEGL
jgi:hypothetical protein